MGFTTVLIDGGLDLKTPPVAVAKGRLYACDNFEVAQNQGCRRVDGFERFDGGPSPSTSDCVAFRVAGNVDATAVVGKYAFIEGVLSAAIVLGASTSRQNNFLFLRANAPIAPDNNKSASFQIDLYDTPEQAGSPVSLKGFDAPVYPLAEGMFTADAWQRLVERAYLAIREKVQPVPGTGRVVGMFWLKDALYAARDYLAFNATGIDSDLAPDDVVAGAGGFLAKVFSIDADIDGSGTIVLHSAIGGFQSGALTIGVDTVATVTSVADSPGAGLYKAAGTRGTTPETQSWEHQDLGYSFRFKDGSIEFPAMNRLTGGQPDPAEIQVTPWFVAGHLVSKVFGQVGGTIPGVIAGTDVDDTIYASAPSTLNYGGVSPQFHIDTFGIADEDLPDGSALTGIEVEIKRRAKITGVAPHYAKDLIARWEYPGSALVNFGNTETEWPKSSITPDFANYGVAVYGGPNNMLGCDGITPETIKADNFGFGFYVNLFPAPISSASPMVEGRVSMVRMRVHFIPPQPSFYLWDLGSDSPTAVVVNIVKSYPDAGDPGTGDSEGTLYVMNNGTPRAVHAGEQIRSMPQPGTIPDGGAADGSTLVGIVASGMVRNVLDGSAKLDTAGSKYQHVTANFFASANFEAIHGVSGAGPAFLYDGYAFARILTGLPLEKETPRHVAVHQSRLFLLYGSGIGQYSVPGDPLDFRAVAGAGEFGIASPATGAFPLNGQTLALFTRSNVQMMQGDVGAPTMGVIDPDVGCIEYSAVSSGAYLYVSNRGLESMKQTAAYGDFATEPLSSDVSPWLSDRVQKSVAYEGADRSLVGALPVRSKQQVRLFFKDKKALTFTFLRPGELPQATMQTYPVLFQALLAATESTGRDRIFGATDDGYVFELDRGNRFDGEEIAFSLTLATDDQQHPWVKKTFTDAHIHGIAMGFGTFTMSRAVDYDAVDASIVFPQTFGVGADIATVGPAFKVSFTEVRAFGRSITFRFDGKTGREPPITLQAVSYNLNPAGEKRT